MLNMNNLSSELNLTKTELNKLIGERLGISQAAICLWWQNGIPANRQIELVNILKLKPSLLIDKGRKHGLHTNSSR